jgi:hypothetical protein
MPLPTFHWPGTQVVFTTLRISPLSFASTRVYVEGEYVILEPLSAGVYDSALFPKIVEFGGGPQNYPE